MKTIKCYDCEAEFTAESREEMLNHFYKHYMEVHKEVITGASDEEKKTWMARFEQDWAAAPTA